MKKQIFKNTLFVAIFALLITGCVSDDDTSLPNYTPVLFGEDFEINAVDNTELAITGWNNYAEAGTAKWKFQYYSSNNYAEFTSYQSGQLSNIGWLISPAINLDGHANAKLMFQVSQSYVTSAANSLEVLISTDYDGTNVTGATWQHLPAVLPGTSATYFEFQTSEVDLSAYTGNVYIAFKVKGSGTNTTLDGSYQIDNVRIIN